MNDLISRQAAIDTILGITAMQNAVPLDSAIFNIKKLPSAQPEIIRCKDCKYAHLTRYGKCEYCDTLTDDDGYPLDLYVDGDFYCGNAERRTDG